MRRLPLAAIQASRAIAEAMRCQTCGKLTTVSNTNLLRGKRGLQLERVSAETHCDCPGGPAAPPPKGKTDADFMYGAMVVGGNEVAEIPRAILEAACDD